MSESELQRMYDDPSVTDAEYYKMKKRVEMSLERASATKTTKKTTTTIINCENCKYDKCEFYNKSGNSWCPRCKGVNYHK